MIITRLKGGMGNQMFQYALGRRLAHDLNTELKLDITGYDHQPANEVKRYYDLNHYNITENFATAEEIKKLKYPYGLASKISQAFKSKILRNFHIGYEPEILKKKGDVYLDGFWHNEKYFLDIRDILLKEFTLKEPFAPAAQKIVEEIKASPQHSVALHVRRGDYATDPIALKHNGLMTTEYYGGAIELLKNKLGSIKVFAFSDDIEWVKKHVPLGGNHTFVSHAGLPYSQEIILMSLCSHQIIANSTFSWWGAWLNQNPNKIVIAPAKWLASKGGDYYKEIPESWIKI